ncbi:MAG TPA: phosphatase PAP2 family protein [Acidiferrobacteraceae bacterium]|nr:phosphatase PAP2 family protein [Acidiferrobacteraceae bacterium]
MNSSTSDTRFQRMDRYEIDLCLHLNHSCRSLGVQPFFSVISRLGDGVFWYLLVLALPVVYGYQALPASLHMTAVAICGLLIYKFLKTTLVRHRPYTRHDAIQVGGRALDQGSFPSGHTLHALAFSIVGVAYYPELIWLVAPFSVVVALSRVVLGLHYPSDVLAGGAIGAVLALVSFTFL